MHQLLVLLDLMGKERKTVQTSLSFELSPGSSASTFTLLTPASSSLTSGASASRDVPSNVALSFEGPTWAGTLESVWKGVYEISIGKSRIIHHTINEKTKYKFASLEASLLHLERSSQSPSEYLYHDPKCTNSWSGWTTTCIREYGVSVIVWNCHILNLAVQMQVVILFSDQMLPTPLLGAKWLQSTFSQVLTIHE
jgi:hypothetical protein